MHPGKQYVFGLLSLCKVKLHLVYSMAYVEHHTCVASGLLSLSFLGGDSWVVCI